MLTMNKECIILYRIQTQLKHIFPSTLSAPRLRSKPLTSVKLKNVIMRSINLFNRNNHFHQEENKNIKTFNASTGISSEASVHKGDGTSFTFQEL